MANYGHLSTLDEQECRQLLRSQTVGRVGWVSASGIQILPVTYGVADRVIVFRTQVGSPLAELVGQVEVSFEVDDLDSETATGWSVLVHGRSGAKVDALPASLPDPWAPGERPIVIGIACESFAGRSVAAD